jgi:dipeptidyl aminopeptidase/acylaminoacyl peptidase
VVVHEFPSLKATTKYRLEIPVGRAAFSPEGKLLIIGSDGGIVQLLEVRSDEHISRYARMGSLNISRVAGGPEGVWFSTDRRSATLFAMLADGERRALARSRQFGPTSASGSGDVVIEEGLPGGRRVIGLYTAASRRYRRATDGPADSDPLFHPDGRSIAYVDRVRRHIRLCALAPTFTCRSIAQEQEVSSLAGFSPGGDRLAFFSLAGARSRLMLVSLGDGAVSDVGLGSPKRCKVRWSETSRLWTYRSEQSEWIEVEIASRAPTGKTEKVEALGPDGCPAAAGAQPAVGVVSIPEGESALWFKRN